MKHSVLCVQRSLLPELQRASIAAISKITVAQIPYDAFSFINRRVVDAKRAENTTHFSIGTMFPQVLPYMVVKCGQEYLMYNRKGKEERLHGLMSMGIGGHIDIHDLQITEGNVDFLTIISDAAKREVEEEVGYTIDKDQLLDFTYTILSPVDEVSQVHMGLLATIEVSSKDEVKPTDEIINPIWVHESDLMKYYQKSEEWTRLIIEGKFQDARYN